MERDTGQVDITRPAAGGGPAPLQLPPLTTSSPPTPINGKSAANPSAPPSRMTSEQEIMIQSNVFFNQLLLIDNKINGQGPGAGQPRKGSFLMPVLDNHVCAAPPTAFQRYVVHPCAVVFVTMELESSSPLAWVISNVVMLVILLAIFATVVASEPTIMHTPATCPQPACKNHPKWCPGRMICAPQPPPVFDTIENVCIYFFTLEYGLKFLTCWSVTPRAAGILPKDDTVKALELAEDDDEKNAVEYGPIAQTWRWVIRIKNLIDLACWLPFYIALVTPDASASSTYVRAMRLLRLIRVFRLLHLLHMFEQVRGWSAWKCVLYVEAPSHPGTPTHPYLTVFEQVCATANLSVGAFRPCCPASHPLPPPRQMYAMTQLVIETLSSAWPVLAVFLFFSFLIIVVFGSTMYFIESGTYTVDVQYPAGAYVRLALDRQSTEVTPFTSIGAAFYWVIVTGATGKRFVAALSFTLWTHSLTHFSPSSSCVRSFFLSTTRYVSRIRRPRPDDADRPRTRVDDLYRRHPRGRRARGRAGLVLQAHLRQALRQVEGAHRGEKKTGPDGGTEWQIGDPSRPFTWQWEKHGRGGVFRQAPAARGAGATVTNDATDRRSRAVIGVTGGAAEAAGRIA